MHERKISAWCRIHVNQLRQSNMEHYKVYSFKAGLYVIKPVSQTVW